MGKISRSTGAIKYFDDHAILEIDKGIEDFYYSLIPKSKRKQRQMHSAHITIVRPFEKPPYMDFWGDYEGIPADFVYDNEIQKTGDYYVLKAFSARIGMIRQELGLPYYRDGFHSYHISIGNDKF